MKKIFNILLILSVSINLFSQDYFNNSDQIPLKYNGDNSLSGNFKWYFTWDDNLEGQIKTYLVSYAADDDFKELDKFDSTIVKGELYVHTWNFFTKKWEICSDIIQTDYTIWTMDYNLHDDKNHLVYNQNKITSSYIRFIPQDEMEDASTPTSYKKDQIKKLENGCIILLIQNFSRAKNKACPTYYSIVVLVPDGWKYKSTRFEEIEKNERRFYSHPDKSPKITENGNSFIYELYEGWEGETIKLHFTLNENKTVDLEDNNSYVKNSSFRKL